MPSGNLFHIVGPEQSMEN